jgi:hypothetical protein
LTSTELFDRIENWWGEPFDEALIQRMVNAPKKHQRLFGDEISGFRSSLSAIPSGKLRPMLGMAELEVGHDARVSMALRLLLYVHEVVIDTGDLPSFNPDFRNNDASYYESLRRLHQPRPLIVDGSIKFAPIISMTQHPFISPRYHELAEQIKIYPPEGEDDPDVLQVLEENQAGAIGWVAGVMVLACQFAAENRAHTLALSEADEVVRDLLMRQRLPDRRHVFMQSLASLNLPDMHGNITELIQIRESDAEFGQWRQHLSNALSYIGDMRADSDSIDEASEVVYAELCEGLAEVNEATQKSPALQALRGGIRGLAISGVSAATTGALSGNPLEALASGTAGKAADAVMVYLEAIRKRRKDKLILDVAMSFKPEGQ